MGNQQEELTGQINIRGDQQAVSAMRRLYTSTRNTTVALVKLLTTADLSQTELSHLSNAAMRASKGMDKFGSGLHQGYGYLKRYLLGVTALGGGMAAAGRTYGRFTEGLSEVSTLLGPGQDALAMYGEDVKRLSILSGQATDIITKGLYQGLSASVPQDNLISFMSTASDLAIGGVTTLDTAVDGLTSVLNAYGLKTAEATKVSATMFQTMRLGKTTVGEVAGSIGQVAPLAAQLGVNFQELGAEWVSLTKTGLSTPEATTQMKALLTGMLKPTTEATEMAREWGFAWDAASNVARVKSLGLVGALNTIQHASGGAADKLAVLLPNVRALGGAMRLTSEAGRKAFDEALHSMPKTAEEAMAQIEDAVTKRKDSIGFKMGQLTNALKVAWLEVGDGIVHGFIPDLDSAVQAIDDARPKIRANAQAFATGIKTGLLQSGIGDTMRDLFDTAEQKKGWQNLGHAIGKMTGDVISALDSIAKAINGITDALGGASNAAWTFIGIWGTSKALGVLKALGLIGAAGANGAGGAAGAGGAVAAAGGGVLAGSAWTLAGIYAYGKAAAGPVQDALLDHDQQQPIRSVAETVAPASRITHMAGIRVATSAERAALRTESGSTIVTPMRPLRPLIRPGANANNPTDIAGGARRWDLSRTPAVQQRYLNSAASVVGDRLDRFAGNLENLGETVAGALTAALKNAETNINTVSEIKIKDGRGGSSRMRREERGAGPALGPRVALSNFFVLTDRGEIEAIPDEFIFTTGPAPAVMQ